MKNSWNFYDQFNEFTPSEAACLWLGYDATDISEYGNPPHKIKMLKARIEEVASKIIYGDQVSNPSFHFFQRKLSREELIAIANEIGTKPYFLFPETREDQLSIAWEPGTISKPSYQELIRVLLHEKLDVDSNIIDPIDKGAKTATDQIKKLAELAGSSLSAATIRGILDEIWPERLNHRNRRKR